MTFSTKILFVLLILCICTAATAAELTDLRVPLKINSQFVLRTEEGLPANQSGLNKFAPSYLFKFTKSSYKREVSFSPKSDYIIINDYYGNYKLPSFQIVGLTNFVGFRRDYALNDSWRGDLRQSVGKAGSDQNKGAVQLDLPWDLPKPVTAIVGEGKSNIRVTGSRSISFSGKSEWEDNLVNTGTFKQSKFPTLQMEQKSRFKVTGTIGSKITVEVDQDSQRDVELANTIKLRYKGEEDDILQSIEAGNTNLNLPNAQFIGYSQNVQGLFGIKSTAKIGKLDLTMITSQEKGSSEKATFSAGARGSQDTIRDYDYLRNTYFWLRYPNDTLLTPMDSCISVELYIMGNSMNRDPYGIACVNPADSLPYISPGDSALSEFKYVPFKPIDPQQQQFRLYRQSWFIVLDQPISENEVLAAYIRFARYDASGRAETLSIGNLGYRQDPEGTHDTTYVLRLLKNSNSDPRFRTWGLMWRNVYDLRARNLSSEGFDLKIYRGQGDLLNDPEDQAGAGTCFITLLGLDNVNNTTNTPGADCIFDFNQYVIDATKGHLIFPVQQAYTNPNPFDSPVLDVKVPEIYTSPQGTNFANLTKYYIWVKSAQRASTYTLGRTNIIEGSEIVKLGDGTVLRRGVDYSIDYDIGQITFLSEQAMNPGANVSVDYEFAPFFAPEKKSLFGMAGQYNLWENSNISLATMYRSETANDPRPRVGREPNRGLIWDGNFQFSFKPGFMTAMVDALPLVEAEAPSQFDITGEVAQSFPNPNTKNVAYIDDFEGTRTYTDLSTRRSMWTQSSAPLEAGNIMLDLNKKGKLIWYNPWDPVPITSIWPDREVKGNENRQDVLWLEYTPNTTLEDTTQSWAGIIRPLYTGLADQTLTKFIEIWFQPDPSYVNLYPDDDPVLHIDLGQISEDLDNSGGLPTSEDRATLGARGVFEPDEEDTGLDGKFDINEPGYDPSSNPDPSGDDWHYDTNNPYDYSHINGTEGNKDDPDRRGRFDTEDINNNGSLDAQNGYYEYTVHLKDSTSAYIVDKSFNKDGSPTGWKLLRIPFQDVNEFDSLGTATTSFSRILFARLWFSGMRGHYKMALASVQLAGNKWQGPVAVGGDSTLYGDEGFEVTVKNTQENSDYEPPPGVAGHLDRETGIREKEQSLILVYKNLRPDSVAADTSGTPYIRSHGRAAYWSLYQPEDYTHYARMKMFVHGDTSAANGKVKFFLRLSSDGQNYYEYHTYLEPGWSTNNEVDIDFAQMTNLKYELQKDASQGNISNAYISNEKYAVKGNPSLSQIKWFFAGVEVDTSATTAQSGEVWLDELRVTDIRKTPDFAGRLQVTARFSDFLELGAAYNRTGADFVSLAQKVSAGATSTSQSYRASLRVDKLFPPSMALSLPVSGSWQNTVTLPRLKPGSDIILLPADSRTERSESKSYTFSTNESFNKNTKNWLWNMTFNRIKTGYTFSRTEQFSPANPLNNRNTYKGTGSYDLTPKAKPGFKPFFWTKYLLMPKGIYDAKLFYLPTQLSFSGELNGSSSVSATQRGIYTYTRARDLLLSGTGGISLFSSLRTSYNISGSRDISEPGRFKLSIDPKKLKLGREETFQQRFETAFAPRIFKFLDNNVSYSSSFGENADIKQHPDSTRGSQMSSTIKTEATLNLQTLFAGKSGGGRRPQEEPAKGKGKIDEDKNSPLGNAGKPEIDSTGKFVEKPVRERPEPEEESSGPRAGSPRWLFRQFGNLFRSIKPIRGSYLTDKKFSLQGLMWRPGWRYIFGLSENPGVPVKSSGGLSNPSQSVYSNSFALDSGLQPGHGLDISSGYSIRKTETHSSNDPVMTKSITFPDVTVNLSGLEKFILFKSFSSAVGVQSGYSKKVDENGRPDTGQLFKRETTSQFSPLGAVSLNFKNNIKTTIRYDLSKIVSKNLRDVGQAKRDVNTTDGTFKVSFSYSFTAPQGIKLPLLKRLKFNSQLTINLDITSKNSQSESINNGLKSVDSKRSQFVVEPRLTYQFSKAITGGIRARWDDSNDKIQKRKHHIRELGITAEIKF